MMSQYIRYLLLATLLLVSVAVARAQQSPPRPTENPLAASNDKNDRPSFGADAAEEMRTKLAIKADQKQYQENVDRAREASELGSQIFDAYQSNKIIGSEEAKKLERLEKLTKKIRSDAGGQAHEDDASDMPSTLDKAIKGVATLAGELCKDVEKTPRHVISAVVIDRANNLLGLIQRVRKLLN